MDLNIGGKRDTIELEERMAAPKDTHIPLMAEDSGKEKRIQEGFERTAPAQTSSSEERRAQATKISTNAYITVAPFVQIAMIVIGSLYLDDCKVQPFIPIYLVVAGSVGILQNFLTICKNCFCSDSAACVFANACVSGLMGLFMFIWFILGCVWVYGVKEVEYVDTSKDDYCHKTLYLFSFWLLNATFIVLGLSIVLIVCGICCITVCLSIADD